MTTVGTPLFWVGFNVLVLGMLVLDLGVFHRKAHAVSLKEASLWSGVWVVLACLFGVGVWHLLGADYGKQYFAGYLIEKALSVDNLFVILVVMGFFAVPKENQHKVLFWGVLGALAMRAVFIFVGAALLSRFHWMMYGFGILLVWSAVKLLFQKEEELNPERNFLVRAYKRFFPATHHYVGAAFFIKEDGVRKATPLFLSVLAVEAVDLVFAVDSIPAVFAISQDAFIVYTSNIFAILGLRSLYFLLAGVMDKFHLLKYGLSLILLFVGAKMLLVDIYKIPINLSLILIGGILALTVVASLLFPAKPKATDEA
ncbi:MAG: TerC family protein [Proteobacteria bacterium]|nr:TerC family protein [Cystobacterineae bacterium]MCL2259442.1 TerC family protein [Cystobacterineae bacterium]MCL2314212.1 TerC family protein [Pseudomonadota bacterium]